MYELLGSLFMVSYDVMIWFDRLIRHTYSCLGLMVRSGSPDKVWNRPKVRLSTVDSPPDTTWCLAYFIGMPGVRGHGAAVQAFPLWTGDCCRQACRVPVDWRLSFPNFLRTWYISYNTCFPFPFSVWYYSIPGMIQYIMRYTAIWTTHTIALDYSFFCFLWTVWPRIWVSRKIEREKKKERS